MTTCNWLGRAKAVAQLNTITPANVGIGNTFTVTVNGKAITFTATATTVANVTAGLVALLTARTEPEFTAITWADATTAITATAVTAGTPFTSTSSATGGTATLTTVVTTAATGPNHWDNAANWDSASVPINGDTANVNLSIASVLYGLGQSAVTLAALNITTTSDTSNTIGLPPINGAGYSEYLTQYLQIGATLVKIDANAPRIKIDFGSVAMSAEVRRTGTSQDAPTPPLLIKGTSTSNVLDVVFGTVGAAYYDGESFAAATITNGQNGTLTLGSGTTTATTVTNLGTLYSYGLFTTFNQGGGTAEIDGTPSPTTIIVTGGTLNCRFSGTATTVNVGPGTLDASIDLTARTFTNCSIFAGGSIVDPQETIVYTNKITKGSGVDSLTAA